MADVKIPESEGLKKILVMADFLEKLPPNRFNLKHWVNQWWKGDQKLECGTTACVIGWAPTVFPDDIKLDRYGIPIHLRTKREGHKAAADLFEISPGEATALFIPGEDWSGESYQGVVDSAEATPILMAKILRRFVEIRMDQTKPLTPTQFEEMRGWFGFPPREFDEDMDLLDENMD